MIFMDFKVVCRCSDENGEDYSVFLDDNEIGKISINKNTTKAYTYDVGWNIHTPVEITTEIGKEKIHNGNKSLQIQHIGYFSNLILKKMHYCSICGHVQMKGNMEDKNTCCSCAEDKFGIVY